MSQILTRLLVYKISEEKESTELQKRESTFQFLQVHCQDHLPIFFKIIETGQIRVGLPATSQPCWDGHHIKSVATSKVSQLGSGVWGVLGGCLCAG